MACKAISRESFQILGLGFFSILLLKKKVLRSVSEVNIYFPYLVVAGKFAAQ